MQISAKRIKTLMAKQGMTTKMLAEKMNIKANNLSAIITRGSCRPNTVFRIASALDVDISEILMEE